MQREELKVIAERAVLVQVQLPRAFVDERDPLGELRELTVTAGSVVVGELTQKRQKPRGSTFLGKGKIQELVELIKLTEATLVIFDNDLLPRQIRALEEEISCKLIDRSELILDIFANRATTHEARLQVEIAQLQYTYPRLRAMWDHLGKIVGGAPVGIGTRGPGEQQLEIDRRLARARLGHLKQELIEIQKRKKREVAHRNEAHFTVGLVGYTNAGKSTLFNRATSGGAFVHQKLFATLSTRVEMWNLGGGNGALLSDTVGFIRDLPHHLVASFRSTLEETVWSKLIILVLDVTDPNARMQLDTVTDTLDDIGATEQQRLLVLNKVDQLADRQELLLWLNRHPDALPISALTGEGIDDLQERVMRVIHGGMRVMQIQLPLRDSRAIDYIEKRAEVMERQYTEDAVIMTARVGRRHIEHLLTRGTQFLVDGNPPLLAVEQPWTTEPVESNAPPHEQYWDRTDP